MHTASAEGRGTTRAHGSTLGVCTTGVVEGEGRHWLTHRSYTTHRRGGRGEGEKAVLIFHVFLKGVAREEAWAGVDQGSRRQ